MPASAQLPAWLASMYRAHASFQVLRAEFHTATSFCLAVCLPSQALFVFPPCFILMTVHTRAPFKRPHMEKWPKMYYALTFTGAPINNLQAKTGCMAVDEGVAPFC